MPVQDPSKLTTHTISGTVATLPGLIQTWMRATLALGDELYTIQYVPSKYNNQVTAYIVYEDQ